MTGLASRHRTSLALGSCWALSWAVLAWLPDRSVEQLLRFASTTLPRLAAWPVTLPLSGLLVREDLAVWLVALALGAAQLERQVGWRRTLVLLAAVHAGASLLSQALLGLRVLLDHAPAGLLDQVDVGPSYLAVAGLAAAAVTAPTSARRLLPLSALLVGLPELLEGLDRLDLAATGHVASALLGATGGWWLRRAGAGGAVRHDAGTSPSARNGPRTPTSPDSTRRRRFSAGPTCRWTGER